VTKTVLPGSKKPASAGFAISTNHSPTPPTSTYSAIDPRNMARRTEDRHVLDHAPPRRLDDQGAAVGVDQGMTLAAVDLSPGVHPRRQQSHSRPTPSRDRHAIQFSGVTAFTDRLRAMVQTPRATGRFAIIRNSQSR